MNQIFTILKQKKLQFIFLFYILLILPILSPIAENISTVDKIAIFVICGLLFVAISILSTFISSKAEKGIYLIILIISIVPGAIYLAYLLFAHVLLEQNSVTSLFETNPDESKEFVAHYLSIWVNIGVLIYAAIPFVMICKMKSFKRLKIRDNKFLFIASIVTIIAIVSINQLSRSVYFINIYKTYISYKIRVDHEIKAITERQAKPFEVINTQAGDSVPQTIVVVIGESLSRHHMSLYGYERNTNPGLSEHQKNNAAQFYVYEDVVSPQVHTIPVIRSVMSMSELENPKYFTQRPSLFELYNRAGYETYLISNQEFGGDYKSSFDILLTLAQHQYNLAPNKSYDAIVLPKLKEVLAEESDKNRLIVIHLIGNHMAYEFRYPYLYSKFDHQKDNLVADAPFRDEEAKRRIDRYDNAVLYNDYIISDVIKSLADQQNQRTAMIYFSDHAEELYDYREFAGHAYEKVSPTMCEIPFMVWMSDDYKTKHSDLVFNTSRPYSTCDFVYSISDFTGITYDGYDDTRSLFSARFAPRKRYVGEKEYNKIKDNFEKELK